MDFRIKWNDNVLSPYTTGVDRGVFYIPDTPGIAWTGLVSVDEPSPETVMNQSFIDGQKVYIRKRALDYKASLTAFTYPPEFEPYSGYNPSLLRPFSFAYRVMTGETSYRIHLVYNIVASPDDVVFSTLADALDPTTFSWQLTSKPVNLAGRVPSSHIVIDTALAHEWTVAAIEEQLYGGEGVIAHMPTPAEIETIFQDNAILKVVDNGDGTATITGPPEAIQALALQQSLIDWPSVKQVAPQTYQITSL